MWLIATYHPVALFSLKIGTATATGGKSLLIPSPYAIRMALLDVALRVEGNHQGEKFFSAIHSLDIALRPSRYAVVTNLFAKVQKPVRSDKEKDSAMQPTIAFREYVQWRGDFAIALSGENTALSQVKNWLPFITYFGKRGSFVQFDSLWNSEEKPPKFTSLTQPLIMGTEENQLRMMQFPLGTLQLVDDWGETLTFEKASSLTDASIILGDKADRTRYSLVIPYHFRQAGRGFTLYEVST